MNPQNDKKSLDELLSLALGRENLKFDFAKWQNQHQPEIRQFRSQAQSAPAETAVSHHTWRIIMKSPITKFAAAAAVIVAVVLTMNIFNKSIPTVSAAQVLQEAIDAVSDIWSVHMKAQMRTIPHDNFSMIGLNYDFVPIEMWQRTDETGLVQWRVEKPQRILLMDGQTTTMLIRPNNAVRADEPWPLGCFDSWMGRLLNVRDLLDNVLQQAKNNPDQVVTLYHANTEGKDTIVLEVEVKADVPENDYLRNSFISNSDHLNIYQFDARDKLLDAFQVYAHTQNGDVLIFEVTNIEYNTQIADSVFTLDLPKDVIWYQQPQPLPDNQRYEKMTPKEVAQAFFHACSKEDWDEAAKFWSGSKISDPLKKYLGGLEIISIGEPFKSLGYTPHGWFVPYEIRLKKGPVKKFNLAIRNDNPAQRYIVDGGI